jgi:hypothetical protein
MDRRKSRKQSGRVKMCRGVSRKELATTIPQREGAFLRHEGERFHPDWASERLELSESNETIIKR